MVITMTSNTFKAAIGLLLIAVAFSAIGCAGRNNQATATPTPVATGTPVPTGPPAPTGAPTPTLTPTPAPGNYTTTLSASDVNFSDDDQNLDMPEDDLPTPAPE